MRTKSILVITLFFLFILLLGNIINAYPTTATGFGAGFRVAKGVAKGVDKVGDVADVVKATDKTSDFNKVARDPKVKSDFLKVEAQKPDAIQKYGKEGVEAMKEGRSPSGFQVHHKEPLYAGGSDMPSNLEIVQKGSGPAQHPGTHQRSGETYNKYGPPQNYRGDTNKKTEKGFFGKIVNKIFGNRK